MSIVPLHQMWGGVMYSDLLSLTKKYSKNLWKWSLTIKGVDPYLSCFWGCYSLWFHIGISRWKQIPKYKASLIYAQRRIQFSNLVRWNATYWGGNVRESIRVKKMKGKDDVICKLVGIWYYYRWWHLIEAFTMLWCRSSPMYLPMFGFGKRFNLTHDQRNVLA